MRKWAILLAGALLATSQSGCYWRPGYYLNGGGYQQYPPAQPVYAQPQYAQPQACAPACPPGYVPAQPNCSCY